MVNEMENAVVEEISLKEGCDGTPEPTPEEAEPIDELSSLRQELEALRSELKARDEREEASSRFLKEMREFSEYFPEVELHEIPCEIWEQVRRGASLSASFALSLKRLELERKRVTDVNQKNRRMSAGSLTKGDGDRYYSPAEVKAMTPLQVRSHYDDIIESMRHWN